MTRCPNGTICFHRTRYPHRSQMFSQELNVFPGSGFVLNALIESQSKDLKVVAGEASRNAERERRSDFFNQPCSTSSLLLDQNSTLPGWTFQGTVQYVTSLELPDTGHAIQLGEDGKINQTFIAKGDDLHYILTFALIPGGKNCSASAGLIVSGPDSNAVFSYRHNYSQVPWQSYSHNLGSWGNGEPINLVLESQTIDSDTNSTCWPIVDTLLIKTVGVTLVQDSANGGFESGPGFLPNSTEGVLIDAVPSLIQSALRQWSITGTVRYIDSEHFHVPEGIAAIEILADTSPSGIQTATRDTSKGSRYNLTFTLGDANDACRGYFVVGVQAGSAAQNFTLESNGLGRVRSLGWCLKQMKLQHR
ncbi:unnamed protein product [Arabis nemorensis]|uniref:DUF642 domain-containing protein n=1 Tax=Arabis nemorensis TaxID=586526 RepID=A0A565CLI2_9BRAS|nr:unnamed protein product [Arabis nemorensis]